ncbi:TIGR00289 family protein [Candidatus Bathyarchaeota archaeon]|nr:TIGR00289 family protein [Candidatus Bathyarchaeota archaeon]
MRVAVLATGGKDSTLALYRAMKDGHEVKTLVCMIPQREDSYMFHYPNINLIDFFAKAVEIPLMKGETAGEKGQELEDLKRLLSNLDVEGIVSGAIASNYQKTRIESICKQLGFECLTPLWHEDPYKILKEMLELEFEVIITGVYAYGFDASWLGRKIDDESIGELIKLNRRYGVSLVGEGGEYETLVLDAQFFKKRIKILDAEKLWDGQRGYFLIRKALLQDK